MHAGLLITRSLVRTHSGARFIINVNYYLILPGAWLSGLRRSRVHSLMIARRSLCPSNPGQGSKRINFSGWHGLDMSITVTKRR